MARPPLYCRGRRSRARWARWARGREGECVRSERSEREGEGEREEGGARSVRARRNTSRAKGLGTYRLDAEPDERQEGARDDGEVREVVAHGRASGHRERDAEVGADHAVEDDGNGDDAVAEDDDACTRAARSQRASGRRSWTRRGARATHRWRCRRSGRAGSGSHPSARTQGRARRRPRTRTAREVGASKLRGPAEARSPSSGRAAGGRGEGGRTQVP